MATVHYFVDTAATGGDGDGRGHGSGAGDAFASLFDAEAALDGLTHTGNDVYIWCAGGADATVVNFTGWSNPPDLLVIAADDGVTADEGTYGTYDDDGKNPTGIFSTDYYYCHFTTSNTYHLQSLTNGNMEINDLQFLHENGSANDRCINLYGASVTQAIRRNIFKLNNTGFSGSSAIVYDGSGSDFIIESNLIYNTVAEGATGITGFACNTALITNNTVFGFSTATGRGIITHSTSSGTHTAINNIMADCITNDIAGFGVGWTNNTNNSTDDSAAAGDNWVDISPGTEATDWAEAFVDYANGDFRLKHRGSIPRKGGDATQHPATDILGNAFTGGEIGAFSQTSSHNAANKVLDAQRTIGAVPFTPLRAGNIGAVPQVELEDFRDTYPYVVATGTAVVAGGTGTEEKTLPGTPQTGDLILIMRACDNELNADAISGYTSIVNTSDKNPGFAIEWKAMGATPDTTVTIPQHGTVANRHTAVAMYLIRNADTTTPVDAVSSVVASSGITVNPPALTPAQVNSLKIIVGAKDDYDDAASVVAPVGNGWGNFIAEEGGTGSGLSATIMAAELGGYLPASVELDPNVFSGGSNALSRTIHLALTHVAAAGGSSVPIFVHHYTQMRGAA